ncbi:MAG: DUF1015 domain-containing protein [Ktedonobacterales bacterium]|nr:DUF1015 domain-containing protein [Ktedonobacterales bacterium]
MADVRPLPGIRYAAEAELAALVTPPYDVISPEAQANYYERHPHNLIRLELGREGQNDDALDNRYTRAAAAFAEWRLHGVLRQDAPSLYLYEQRFAVAGGERRRLSVLARVRVEPWEEGIILPHERTLSKPKDDRLRLTRACAATISPIMALYDDPEGELARSFAPLHAQQPQLALTDDAGEEHRVWLMRDPLLANTVAGFFATRQLYIADGHHRYETALAYRDEVRELHKELPLDDGANFTLMALIAIEDPGLVVLPTHRILRAVEGERLAALEDRLRAHFEIEALDGREGTALVAALARAGEAGQRTALVVVRPEDALLLRLRPEGAAAMDRLFGKSSGASAAWRRLDVTILHTLVLREALGISDEAVRAGQHVSYTRDAAEAMAAVRSGADGARLAVLLNATPPAALRDVARAGDRMPQKSTYFYPKLVSGLVINPLW